MLSRWVYLLIGDNNTGKTTFQRKLVEHLCSHSRKKLESNRSYEISPNFKTDGLKSIHILGRSFQEREATRDIDRYFCTLFPHEDLSILSSHSIYNDIIRVIENCHNNFYNVCAIFFSNSAKQYTGGITHIRFQDMLFLKNDPLDKKELIEEQLSTLAKEFSSLLIARSHSY
jgi:hypothetical protein